MTQDDLKVSSGLNKFIGILKRPTAALTSTANSVSSTRLNAATQPSIGYSRDVLLSTVSAGSKIVPALLIDDRLDESGDIVQSFIDDEYDELLEISRS